MRNGAHNTPPRLHDPLYAGVAVVIFLLKHHFMTQVFGVSEKNFVVRYGPGDARCLSPPTNARAAVDTLRYM